MRPSASLLAGLLLAAGFATGPQSWAQTGLTVLQPEGGTLATFPGSVLLHGPAQRVTSGQPYSADQESEHKQTLADGTHLDQTRQMMRTYRDSQGRTRTERFLMQGFAAATGAKQSTSVWVRIYDPVAGYSYLLDEKKHVAHRYPALVVGDPTPEQLKAAAKMSQAGASVTRRLQHEVKSEPLGSQVIEGVQAEGTRTTITTAAGVEGNDRPLSRVCEQWLSPELKILMLSTCSDLRTGETTLRVTHLDRSEPDPGLFQVPPDYTIVDEKDRTTPAF